MPNVFEFLGLPATHRAKNKVVQMVKHFNEVPASKRGYPLLGQVKKDGVYGLIVTHRGTTRIFGRTGEQLTSCGSLIRKFGELMQDSAVYIAEVCSLHPCSLEQLSGVVNPNRVNELDPEQVLIAENLVAYLHDMLSVSELISGVSKLPYVERHHRLSDELNGTIFDEYILPYSFIYDESSKSAFTAACLAAKEEGAVYKQPHEGWVAGHKGYRAMKEVNRVDYDLLCTRVEEGEGKYKGLVANMYFRWKGGTEIKAMPGKGHTHESCRKMFLDPTIAVGKIWRVKGLMNSSKGKVRLPKVEEQRHDKVEADY